MRPPRGEAGSPSGEQRTARAFGDDGSQAGAFMLHAVVLVFLLALIVALTMRVTFGRHVVVHNSTAAQRNQELALAAESRALACLEGTQAGETCAETGPMRACFDEAQAALSQPGRQVRIALAGSPPSCDLTLEVED